MDAKCGLTFLAAVGLVYALLLAVSWSREDTDAADGLCTSAFQTCRRSAPAEDSAPLHEVLIELEEVGQSSANPRGDANLSTIQIQLTFQSMRILISYAQVVSELGPALHVDLPPAFAAVIDKLQVVTADVSAILGECAPCMTVYEQWLVYVLMVPAVMGLLITLLRLWDRRYHQDTAAERCEERGYFVLFLMYPSVCRRSFALFNCRRLGEGLSVLTTDYSVPCSGDKHEFFSVLAAAVITVFIAGVPLVLAWVIFQEKRKSATNSGKDEERWIVNRLAEEGSVSDEDAIDVLQTVRFGRSAAFTSSFKSRFFVWEALDLLRKLLLVGMIIFVDAGSTLQVTVAVVLSFVFFAAHMRVWPCKLEADNILRAACEAHIFLLCVVALVLKSDLRFETLGQEFYGWLLVSTLMVVAGIGVVCVALKMRQASRDLDRMRLAAGDPSALERVSSAPLLTKQTLQAFRLHALGLSDRSGALVKAVKSLQDEHADYKVAMHLSETDRKTLAWVRQELGLTREGSVATMQDAFAKLGWGELDEAAESPPAAVRRIADAIVAQVKADESDGVFLSHYQANAGPDVMELKRQLGLEHPSLPDIWYDKDQKNPSIAGMRDGVRRNRYFIAYLTEDYLLRPFCRIEIRWALAYKKEIILLWKREGNGSVGRFQDWFDACEKSLDCLLPSMADDGGGSDMLPMFEGAAVNYYVDGPFHEASMAELAARLGFATETAEGQVYHFSASTPRVLTAFSERDGKQQVQTIMGELCRMTDPGLDGNVLALEQNHAIISGIETFVLVYLTEHIWSHEDTRVLDALVAAEQDGAQIVLVVETDMAQGWSTYHNAQEPEARVDWSDAVKHFMNEQVGSQYHQLELSFDDVVPYYKDIAFREVSLQIILGKLGAVATQIGVSRAASPDPPAWLGHSHPASLARRGVQDFEPEPEPEPKRSQKNEELDGSE